MNSAHAEAARNTRSAADAEREADMKIKPDQVIDAIETADDAYTYPARS